MTNPGNHGFPAREQEEGCFLIGGDDGRDFDA